MGAQHPVSEARKTGASGPGGSETNRSLPATAASTELRVRGSARGVGLRKIDLNSNLRCRVKFSHNWELAFR